MRSEREPAQRPARSKPLGRCLLKLHSYRRSAKVSTSVMRLGAMDYHRHP